MLKSGIMLIDQNVAEDRQEPLFNIQAKLHELIVEGRFYHITDLTLSLRHQDLQGKTGKGVAAFLL